MTDDEWLKGPKIEGAGYDPYLTYGNILTQVEDEAKDADIDLGELKRDVIDYETMAAAMNKLPAKTKTKLKKRLESKLAEIEQDIDELLASKKEWVKARHGASKPTSHEQALKDVELAKQCQDENALFKFLDRYQYIETISKIEDIVDDGIEGDDVKTLKKILGTGGNNE